MNIISFKSLALSLSLLVSFETQAKLSRDFDLPGADLIYGNDDRHEIDNYDDSDIIEKSQSIAMRVSKKRLTEDRDDTNRILFPSITLKRAIPNLCEDEKFQDQISLGNCSGFLAGPKTIVTAGHCMNSLKECNDYKWVFGFKEGTTELTKNQVYSCKKILHQKYVYNDKEVSDYAVIELDREVVNFKVLKTRKFGRVLLNTPLVVVGHPMGLPMKATDGGVVSRMNDIEREHKFKSFFLKENYFTANLDAYGGNSGSPVFNKRTGKIEGILIQGAEDFVFNNERNCLESRRLSNSHLESYEKIMRITKIPGL